MSEQVYVKPHKGPVRRFVRSLISHLVFALIMVAAAFGWVYHQPIFNRLGDELCTDDRLGGYMTRAQQAQKPAAPPVKLDRATAAPEPAARPADAPAAASLPASTTAALSAAPAPASPAASAAPMPAATPVEPAPAPVAPAAQAPAPAVTSAPAAESKPADARPAATAAVTAAEPAKPVSAAAEPAPGSAVTASREAPAETAASAKPVAEATIASQGSEPAPAAMPKPTSEAAAPSRTVAAAPPPGPDASNLTSEWQRARQTYATDKVAAVGAYRMLIAKNPQVVELRGELGNVYYSLGRMKEAAEQYYEAALRHLDGPEPGLAACLAEVIKPIDAERAKFLEEKTAGRPCPYRRSK